MENQNTNQILNQRDNQEKKTCTFTIYKSYKKTPNQEEIKINAKLVFVVSKDDQNKFLEEEDIQKNVVLVQKCKYQYQNHIYEVNDEISAGSIGAKCENQKLEFYLSLEENFPFEKLKYFLDKNSNLEWNEGILNLNISIKLIVTDIKSSIESRKPKEFDLEAISFDQNAEEYIKDQFVDYKEYHPKILTINRNIQFPDNYPEFIRDKLNLQFKINQIIQQNQPVLIEQFKLGENSLNIQNVYVYTCYQVTIKSKYFAQPLRILSKQQLSNSEDDIVKLSNQNVSQVPFIYNSDKITCKHFLIINLQYKKFFQIRGIDILIPIVIFDPDKKNHYYISKNEIEEYFKMKLSYSMVTFTLNQHIPPNENIKSLENRQDEENQLSQDNIRPHYKQLLNSVDN